MKQGMNYVIGALMGLCTGLVSGFFGVGGGIIMVPAMVWLFTPPIRDIKQAIGTSLVVIIPTALIGSMKHFAQGNIHWPTALTLAPTAICGGFLGAWLTTAVSTGNLRRAFGGLLIAVGAYLLFQRP